MKVREASPNEHDLAQRWQRLPLPIDLPLCDGSACHLLHAGRPGGPQGPDIRDAVLAFHGATIEQTGNVEFHVRCSDWYAHQHHTDPRYNNVILHVVLLYDITRPILRQDGRAVPICSLLDLVPSVPRPEALADEGYPCERILPAMPDEERASLLRDAGLARFDEKVRRFLSELRDSHPCAPFSAYDVCLIPALAEALGYGRDRAFFRAAGLRLVGLIDDDAIPEPLGRAPQPSVLDAGRLRTLGELVERWRNVGAWETVRRSLALLPPLSPLPPLPPGPTTPDTHKGYPYISGRHPSSTEIRHYFSEIGPSRADILICNVILPFAAAVARLEGDASLEARVLELYEQYPALASNQVTRAMRQQLQLEREPRSACQQQGLQHIYAQTCREKRCETCMVAQWRGEA